MPQTIYLRGRRPGYFYTTSLVSLAATAGLVWTLWGNPPWIAAPEPAPVPAPQTVAVTPPRAPTPVRAAAEDLTPTATSRSLGKPAEAPSREPPPTSTPASEVADPGTTAPTRVPASAPTATPTNTAVVVPSPTPDFAPLLRNFRVAQKAAYLTLSEEVMAQIPVFATGEALELVRAEVNRLRTLGLAARLDVSSLEVVTTYMDGLAVATRERHARELIDGGKTVCREVTDYEFAYGLASEDGRWKVEKVRELSRTPIEDTCE